MPNHPIKRALLSVSDKTGIVDFAKGLHQQNITLLSTGGTAALLKKNNIPVTDVSDHTGFPEIMDGRVKTLHPKIHGGLLGRRGQDEGVMAQQHIEPIDLLAVNLYPFQETIAQPDCDLPRAIENIDIGGPAMIRAAAKNHAAVTVVVDNQDYASVLDTLSSNGETTAAQRFTLATKAFAHTAQYDGAIANYLSAMTPEGKKQAFPSTFSCQFEHGRLLRYGENPHQQAAFYVEHKPPAGTLASSVQHQGKPLSYNNIADTDAALACVKAFSRPACVIVKHANPCGVAMSKNIGAAYARAYETDPTSAFGGIIAFNRPLDGDTATAIIEQQFVEVIIAPHFEQNALDALANKPNVRVLACGDIPNTPTAWRDFKRVEGGLLVQDSDLGIIKSEDLKVVTDATPSQQQLDDLLFAWRVAKYVKSNAIVYAKDLQTIGVGAGQMSRIYSARIAAIKAADAELTVKGSVMASDAFFPFPDAVEAAAEIGISAIIQPGGAQRDEAVIAAANKAGIAMVFTGMRHFRH